MGIHAEDKSLSCPAFGKCGACSLLDVGYEDQLVSKKSEVFALFAQIGCNVEINDVLGMQHPYRYRGKVIAPYIRGKGGKVECGMYERGTHKVVNTEKCVLENPFAKKATLAVRDLMNKWGIKPYDEDSGNGFMRHAVARAAHAKDELLVTLVTNSKDFPRSKSFCRQLVRLVPQITTIAQSTNTRKTNVVMGEAWRPLYGPGFILDRLCGASFKISPTSFYQVNSHQTEALYEYVMGMLGLGVKDRTAIGEAVPRKGLGCFPAPGDARRATVAKPSFVVDAYCGTGTMGVVAAMRGAKKVIGFDTTAQAVIDARQNAKHNGAENAEFWEADAEDAMDRISADFPAAENMAVIMDPPRSGSTKSFLDALARSGANRVVYVSCNPKTQARDVEYLMGNGFAVQDIQPVDMFPHTAHIENVVTLARA